MEIYLFVFFINLFFSFFAEKCYCKKTIISFLFLVLLVAFNVVFSGFRDFGVGTDTNVYIEYYFTQAQNLNSFIDFFNSELDKGFLLLAYLSSLFSDDPQSLLFFTALFIHVFIYLSFWQFRKVENVSFFLSTALFCLLLYGHTLNAMRQFCAMAILFYAFSLFIQGKWKLYAILQIVAFFFHSSSVMFILLPVLWNISKMENSVKKNLYSLLVVLGIAVFSIAYFFMVSLLGDMSIISDTYTDRYGSSGTYLASAGDPTDLEIHKLFNFVYPIAFIVYTKFYRAAKPNILHFLLVLSIIISLLNTLSSKVMYMDRISLYFSIIFYTFQALLFSSNKISFTLIGFVAFPLSS